MLTTIFWILLSFTLYTYLGYTLVLIIISFLKKKKNVKIPSDKDLPEVTLLIAAFNERTIIKEKIENSFQLNYPEDKLKFLWITDGSTDGSEQELAKYEKINVLHQPQRKGKTAAINRAMNHIASPITVFCDANTILHKDSIKWLVASLQDKKVGCVAGEKRIIGLTKDKAAGAGEGLYWKYESYIKLLESNAGSTIGAAGELYAIKTELYKSPDNNTIIDDFVVSLFIALKGYKIQYQPKAKATENASYSIKEEKKRKIRIAAGSFQVLFGIPSLLNVFKHGIISFQYISHKVLRWLIVPVTILPILILNAIIVYQNPQQNILLLLLILQGLFYFFVIIGSILRENKTLLKFLFLPFYLIMMNYSIAIGFFRYLKGTQNAAWEKVKRSM